MCFHFERCCCCCWCCCRCRFRCCYAVTAFSVGVDVLLAHSCLHSKQLFSSFSRTFFFIAFYTMSLCIALTFTNTITSLLSGQILCERAILFNYSIYSMNFTEIQLNHKKIFLIWSMSVRVEFIQEQINNHRLFMIMIFMHEIRKLFNWIILFDLKFFFFFRFSSAVFILIHKTEWTGMWYSMEINKLTCTPFNALFTWTSVASRYLFKLAYDHFQDLLLLPLVPICCIFPKSIHLTFGFNAIRLFCEFDLA